MLHDHVNPDDATPTFADSREVAALRESPELAIAWSVLADRMLEIADPDFMIVLTDERGCVLRRAGSRTILDSADNDGFSAGARWQDMGTNGIRLALLSGKPVQLFAWEHWVHSQTRWTCSAFPVLGLEPNKPIAVINSTAPWMTVNGHTLLALSQATLEITRELRFRQRQSEWGPLRETAGPLRRLGRPALVVDRAGVVVAARRWPEKIRFLAAVDQIQPGSNYLAALGRHCDAEPLPHAGWLLSLPPDPRDSPPVIHATLDLTDPKSPRMTVRGVNVVWSIPRLRPLHARIVQLIHQHGGLTSNQLDGLLYGPNATTKAAPELTKLRGVLGGLLAPHRSGDPYRFADHVTLDLGAGR
jgi:hypothetical protein